MYKAEYLLPGLLRGKSVSLSVLLHACLHNKAPCLQSTLLKALAGKLAHSGLQVNGDILYNGTALTEFLPQRTAVYVEQEDQHLPELTVRETFDFAARCQGVGGKAGVFSSSLPADDLAAESTHITVVL